MFKKLLGDIVSVALDAATSDEETTSTNGNANGESTQETITKTIAVSDGYAAKTYLMQKYPKFQLIDFVVPKGKGLVHVGGNQFNITYSLNHATVELPNCSAKADKKNLELTYDTSDNAHEEKKKLAEAICSYVHIYTEYGGMF
ncbi:MAG: hypothetical protein R3Y53_02525 [Bacillota bacterium]